MFKGDNMKNQLIKLALYLGGAFIVALILGMLLQSCEPIRYVNFQSKHNYYERHRHNTYTSPIWIPGHGVMLQTHIVPYRFSQQRPQQNRPTRKR